jgi:putative ABC transport system permease protein
MAWRHTSRRQGRTTLTILGIAIGFGAIIAILSLSFGMKKSIESSFDLIATEAIVLPVPREVYDSSQGAGQIGQQLPGGRITRSVANQRATRIEAGSIDQETLDEIIQTPGIKSYTVRSSQVPLTILWRDREIRLAAIAIDPDAEEKLGQITIGSGTWPDYREALAGQILVRIGNLGQGDEITLVSESGDYHDIEISGTLGENREARFGTLPNIPLFISFETLDLFTNSTGYSTLILSAEGSKEAKVLADTIQAGYPNLTVLTYDDLTETIEDTLDQYSFFLLSIGILAVAVAAIGSANTMIVSTLERTREIGIMKATGAKSGFILRGFLLESALLGLIGGIVGVIFGYIGSNILEVMVFRLNIGRLAATAASGFRPHIPLWLIPFSVGLAVAVTLLSGSYPAWRASRLDPVEAIRYE